MVLRKADVANMHFNCVLAARVLRRYHLLSEKFFKMGTNNYDIISKVLRLFFGFL